MGLSNAQHERVSMYHIPYPQEEIMKWMLIYNALANLGPSLSLNLFADIC